MGQSTVGPSPIVSFTTAYAKPLTRCLVNIKATGGNGTPSAPVPIVGFSSANIYHTGANVWDEQTEGGSINASTGETKNDNNAIRSTHLCPCSPNAEYCLVKPAGTWLGIFWYDENENYISYYAFQSQANKTQTSPSNAKFFKVAIGNSAVPVTTYGNDTSINYPSTDTTYHAYNQSSDTHTIDLGQTVYGGYIDLITGVLTITHEIIDLGNLTWSYFTAQNRFATKLLDGKYTGVITGLDTALCSEYEISSVRFENLGDKKISVGSNFYNSTTCAIVVHDEDYTDADLFKTALQTDNAKLVYELATPITVQLSPEEITAFLGINNFWSDTNGDISVDYISFLNYYKCGQIFVTANSNVGLITTSPAPIANFDTDLALPLKSLVANIKATGGNGTPTTPVPIVGFSSANIYHRGKNLIDLSSLVAGYVNSDGTFNTSQTQGEMRSGFISVKPNTTYYFSIKETSSSYNAWLRVGQYSSEDTSSFIQSNSYWTFTTTATTRYIVISARNLADATKIQLELGNTETAYEPYQGNTHTIDLGQTVYGGYLDLITGVLMITHSTLLDLGNINWTNITANGTVSTESQSAYKFKGDVVCDSYDPYLGGLYELPDNSIGVTNSQANPFIRLRDTTNLGGKTLDEAKTFLSGKTAVIELATPVSIQLTPEEITAFIGSNNFWSDTNGDISASYLKILSS